MIRVILIANWVSSRAIYLHGTSWFFSPWPWPLGTKYICFSLSPIQHVFCFHGIISPWPLTSLTKVVIWISQGDPEEPSVLGEAHGQPSVWEVCRELSLKTAQGSRKDWDPARNSSGDWSLVQMFSTLMWPQSEQRLWRTYSVCIAVPCL